MTKNYIHSSDKRFNKNRRNQTDRLLLEAADALNDCILEMQGIGFGNHGFGKAIEKAKAIKTKIKELV